ncbi:MAG: DEAD/DEAH box helicase [Propionibacteriaceae bacterium]|jgi:ATP-dependent RNA helicase HelY|nr:DEAD/DEAH box helicase [Propionibacteriaceae bacterium]
MGEALAAFGRGYKFALDAYQARACECLEAGSSVLVAAPTGAGKTVVGEFSAFLALRQGLKCFYTTPIKALSNQKFRDLAARHGVDSVGLLTGDTSVNADAPVVVMTTEVLRNMIYAGSSALAGLGHVVLDEVHYLADSSRGAVWEEVIITLPEAVRVAALSATVSNAEEFGRWLAEVRGGCEVVLSEERPVPLFQHVMARKSLYDLFAPTDYGVDVNPELVGLAKQEARRLRDDARNPRGRSGRGRRTNYGSGRYGGQAARSRDQVRERLTPRRDDTITALERAGLLPAIYFIFSRQGCDAAVGQLMRSGLRLTDAREAAQLDRIAERHTEGIDPADLRALGFDEFRAAFRCGVAAHHAGLLPAVKEAVEEGFAAGLVKAVFATETLALGINMPAKSVVLEKLVKYNGVQHADITAGEYTQLTGRAGRRGIDVEGHAVVSWQPGLDPRAVAGLASRRTYPLHSSFKPTYNMAVNMVQTVGRQRARELLESSFAQFQADAAFARRRPGADPSRRRDTIAARFDKVCSVLESLGYLAEGGAAPTEAGSMLARIYSDLDLVTAEAVRDGLFDKLTAPQLAAVVSSLVFESRGDRSGTHTMPSRAAERAQSRLRELWRDVCLAERDHRLPTSPEPDIGFAETIHAWASGLSLAVTLDIGDFTAGDFVRNARQVVDALDQLAKAVGPGSVRETARDAVSAIRRGVVDVANLED